jgi:hypothetical protein
MTIPVLILMSSLLAAMVLAQARRIRALRAEWVLQEQHRERLEDDLWDYASRYGQALSEYERAELEDLAKRLTQ